MEVEPHLQIGVGLQGEQIEPRQRGAEIAEIGITLTRMSARIKRTNNLASGIEDLTANYQRLESDFRDFFPDLIKYATLGKY